MLVWLMQLRRNAIDWIALRRGDLLKLWLQMLYGGRIVIGRRFRVFGPMPLIKVAAGKSGWIVIGDDFTLVNSTRFNLAGVLKTTSIVANSGSVSIGNHVGMSGVSIFSDKSISILDHVKIGANCFIYDTDFHSAQSDLRRNELNDPEASAHVGVAPIVIRENAFVGLNSIILKGVTIGENSIVGAGTVVSKDVEAGCRCVGASNRSIK